MQLLFEYYLLIVYILLHINYIFCGLVYAGLNSMWTIVNPFWTYVCYMNYCMYVSVIFVDFCMQVSIESGLWYSTITKVRKENYSSLARVYCQICAVFLL